MRSRNICLYRVDDPAAGALGEYGYSIACAPADRQALRLALQDEAIDILLVDLDASDGTDVVIEALEIRANLAVVGILSSDDVRRCIQAQRAGCRQIATKPLNPADLATAMRAALNESNDSCGPAKTYGVIGASGGVGATTLTCYLAMAMAETTGSQSAIIDLDLDFGTVASFWDVQPRYTIADIAAAGTMDRLLVEDAILELPCSVGVLMRPARIEQAHALPDDFVKNVIETTGSLYPNLLIDLPRKLDSVTGSGVEACDKLIIVTELTVTGSDNAARLADVLVHFGLPHDRMEFVVNRFSRGVHGVTLDGLESRLGKKLLGVVPNHYKALSVARDLGEPVSQRNPARKAITDIAVKLCGRQGVEAGGGWMTTLGISG